MYLRKVYQTWQEAVREIVTQLLAFEQLILDCANITFTPAGNIAAANVQDAIEELDTEKAAKAGSTGQAFSCSTITAASPGSSIAIEAVTSPTLGNSWVDYDSATWGTARYWKDAYGVVHLGGRIKDGTIGAVAFTLPSGYRPTKASVFAVQTNGGVGELTVNTNGEVTPFNGSNVSFSLSGCTFRTT